MLTYKYADTILLNIPLGLNRGGYINTSGGFAFGGGFVWSKRFYTYKLSYLLTFNSNGNNARHGNGRGQGYSLRCLARWL